MVGRVQLTPDVEEGGEELTNLVGAWPVCECPYAPFQVVELPVGNRLGWTYGLLPVLPVNLVK